MLSFALASLVVFLGLHLERELPPIAEETCDVLHSVVGVEERGHGVEQVFVPVQVFLFLDQLELEAGPNGLVLQRVVVLNVVNQLLQQVSAVVDLQQCGVLLLVRVHAGDLVLHPAVILLLVVLVVEQASGRWLDFLVELEDFDDVGFLTVARAPMMLLPIFALLVAEEVVLGLVGVNGVFIAFVLMAARDAVLVDHSADATCVLLARFEVILRVGHDDFNGFQVFGTGAHPLH